MNLRQVIILIYKNTRLSSSNKVTGNENRIDGHQQSQTIQTLRHWPHSSRIRCSTAHNCVMNMITNMFETLVSQFHKHVGSFVEFMLVALVWTRLRVVD